MKLSAPTTIVFLISLVLAILGVLGRYAGVNVALEPFHWAMLAWVVLAVGNLMRGL